MSDIKSLTDRALSAVDRLSTVGEQSNEEILHLGKSLDGLRNVLDLKDPQVRGALPVGMRLTQEEVPIGDTSMFDKSEQVHRAWIGNVRFVADDENKLAVRVSFAGHSEAKGYQINEPIVLKPSKLAEHPLVNKEPIIAEVLATELGRLADNLEKLAAEREEIVANIGTVV